LGKFPSKVITREVTKRGMVGRERCAATTASPPDIADMPPAWSRKSHEAPGVPLGGAIASRGRGRFAHARQGSTRVPTPME